LIDHRQNAPDLERILGGFGKRFEIAENNDKRDRQASCFMPRSMPVSSGARDSNRPAADEASCDAEPRCRQISFIPAQSLDETQPEQRSVLRESR
jgi:hypothetical protein